MHRLFSALCFAALTTSVPGLASAQRAARASNPNAASRSCTLPPLSGPSASTPATSVRAAPGPTVGNAVEQFISDGLAAARASDWPRAVERFTQAHLLAPDNPVPLYNLGLAHMTAGHPTAAVGWWEAYLAAAPTADNAARLRGEIERVERVALETARGHFEAAWEGLQQITGPERQTQRSDIEYSWRAAAPFFAAALTDSVRLSLASELGSLGEHAAALAHLERVSDNLVRDGVLESRAGAHAVNQDFDFARRYALAIRDQARQGAALRTVDQALEAWRVDSSLDARLRRREYPTDEVAAQIARGGDYAPGGGRFHLLIIRLARHGFYDEALRLMAPVAPSPARDQLLSALAAARLRAGDLDGARAHARTILERAGVPRDEIMSAADAVCAAATGDAERALSIVASSMSDTQLRAQALAAIAYDARNRQDRALADRADQLRNALPGGPERAAVNDLALAFAIVGDYDEALALATIASRDWLIFLEESYQTDGEVADLLAGAAALEAGYGKVAFVAAVRGQEREMRRALERASDPALRYLVHRNAAWGHAVAGRFQQAISALEEWPMPPADKRGAVIAYHYSRAQVLAAVAARAARAGRFDDARRALAAMPAVPGVPARGALLTRLAADAAMDVGDAYVAGGEAESARAMYDLAADFIRAFRTDATAALASGERRYERLLEPAMARLLKSHPDAADRVTTRQRPEIERWTRRALAISNEQPGAVLQRLVERDARDLPRASGYAARRIAEDLLRLEAASPGRARIPSGVEPPVRDRAAQARTLAQHPRIAGTAAWRAFPRVAVGETRSAAWEPGDHESSEKYHDDWVFQTRAGERVTITVSAGENLKLYLATRGPADTANRWIAERTGLNNNHEIAFVAPVDGEYLIYIETYNPNRTGVYTLRLNSSRLIEVTGRPPRASDASLRPSSRCDAATGTTRVGFACPSGWTVTEWTEGTHYVQLNYRHPGDLRVNVNVQLISHGVPVSLWGRSMMVYFDAEDFVRKQRAEVYWDRGLSPVEELVLPNGKWHFFSATAAPEAVSPRLGNLFPVDPYLEPGRTAGRDTRSGLPWNWSEDLKPLTAGTVHHYAVTSLGGKLLVIIVAGPADIVTTELARAMATSATASSGQ